MKYNKLFFTIFISCFISVFMITVSKAQVINENVTLTSQAQIYDFVGSSITGFLLIEESTPGDIKDLTPLSTLTSVGGYLSIKNNTALESLTGLGSLASVDGELYVGLNPALESLTGLDVLEYVGGFLWITSNSELTSLTGLGSLASVDGFLLVELNPVLESLSGLDALKYIGGYLSIKNNTALTSLTGLGSLASVDGELYVGLNPALESLTGLDALNSVGGFLWITSNSELTSLTGLGSLASVDGFLLVELNPVLESLSGLDALKYIGGYLSIKNNTALTSLTGLGSLASVDGELYVGLNPALESLTGLDALNSVGGFLWITSNSELKTLTGLGSLASVGGALLVELNPVLESLDALSNINFIGEWSGVTLKIYSNPMLGSFCGLYPVLSTPGAVGNGFKQISGNLINPTIQQIIDNGLCVSLTPEDMIAELITSVDESGIHKGTKRLLTGFLKSADKSLDRGRERIAILKLVAFKWLVKVQSPRKIDAALADEWIGKAEEIIDAIKTALPKSGELDELASEDVLPETYNLNQNYPNPFNPTTTISYSIPENEYVTLSIYDALGKEVAVLDNGFRTAGNYSHTFDASNLSSGMYFYTIRSGNFVQTKKMLLMK